MLEHIVLFRLYPDADAEAASTVLGSSRPAEGLLNWSVAKSADERKGVVLVQRAVFVDQASFELFKASAPHRAAGAYMAECSDWLIGDVVHAEVEQGCSLPVFE